VQTEPYLTAQVKAIPDSKGAEDEKDFEVIIGSLKDLSMKIVKLNPNISPRHLLQSRTFENSSLPYKLYLRDNTE